MDAARKARLAELRRLKESAEDPSNASEDKGADTKIAFRNYNPLTAHVKALATDQNGTVPAAEAPQKAPAETLETQVKLIEKDAKELLEKQAATSEEVEITSLAPRKPGFDLARELERRMEKLEKRTNYAIAENIRQRFKDTHDISDVRDGRDDEDEDDDE
ncbi:Coiled-coil domain-containing protein 12 [Chytriomyces hyalinus]|nr:Coiled-coil domain-containing protein 12 [Chytriomyces hyalinus]